LKVRLEEKREPIFNQWTTIHDDIYQVFSSVKDKSPFDDLTHQL
jgi:hypothetical protein